MATSGHPDSRPQLHDRASGFTSSLDDRAPRTEIHTSGFTPGRTDRASTDSRPGRPPGFTSNSHPRIHDRGFTTNARPLHGQFTSMEHCRQWSCSCRRAAGCPGVAIGACHVRGEAYEFSRSQPLNCSTSELLKS